jgi:hypothetical protein
MYAKAMSGYDESYENHLHRVVLLRGGVVPLKRFVCVRLGTVDIYAFERWSFCPESIMSAFSGNQRKLSLAFVVPTCTPVAGSSWLGIAWQCLDSDGRARLGSLLLL